MRKVISKQVQSMWPGGGLLNDEYFRSVRERLFNHDRYTQKEDTGAPKKNKVDFVGFGSNDRTPNQGAGMGLGREPDEPPYYNISSGYNDGEQANDETGMADPYYAVNMLNDVFMNLSLQSGNRDRIKRHLNGLFSRPVRNNPKRH